MYRKYLLNNGFWIKKKSNSEVFMKYDQNIGGIYAIIQKEGFNKGVTIIISRKEYYFDNFDKLDDFFVRLQASQIDFMRIMKRKLISQKLRKLEL